MKNKKDLKVLNKELNTKLKEFRSHSSKVEPKIKKRGFLNNFFNPIINDIV